MTTNYSNYVNIFTLIRDNRVQLLDDVTNVVNQVQKVCNDTLSTFPSINTDLSTYLENWVWNEQFWA